MFEAIADVSRQEQLATLRDRMATISGRVGATTGSGVAEMDVIGVDGGLGDLLPNRGLARGSTVACPRGVVLAGLLASATGPGQQPAAVVGGAQLGLVAVAEMGGDLSRLHLVDPTRADVVEVASVLLDGVPVVVVDVDRLTIPPPRWRGLAAKLRNHQGVLIVTSGVRGARSDVEIEARPVAYGGFRRGGGGRVRDIHLEVEVRARRFPPRTGELALTPAGGRLHWTTRTRSSAASWPGRVVAG
ncbi:hypothetical protein [Nocardia cyriacigeorgica]|uniref:hypothetical protein n=1 Tax=Nocardia cyriacigeorgica TaxID=135487 RepID=UPI000CEA18DC|nr:hypothetical protein [Nocardia cyriacigeorgica]PPJ02555.1 hypothetical protein C5E43_26460 [Nocardia cyriacigeorgica]